MNAYRKYGLLFAVVHVFLLIIFFIYKEFIVNDGQSQLLWIIFLVLDFPVSLVTFFGYDFVPVELNAARYYWPYISHLIFGTLWWYFIPRILSWLYLR